MKKYILILSFISFSFISFSRTGIPGFENYSLYYGTFFTPKYGFSNHFELQYEYQQGRGCIYKPLNYFGFGLSATFFEKGEEYGLKYAYNPLRKSYKITRRSIIVPYIYLQGNVKLLYETINKEYNLRPGIGLTYYKYKFGIFSLRSTFQAGYNLNKKGVFKDSFTAELKIGVGYNVGYFKQKHRRNGKKKLE